MTGRYRTWTSADRRRALEAARRLDAFKQYKGLAAMYGGSSASWARLAKAALTDEAEGKTTT